jgi:hypothetical protein
MFLPKSRDQVSHPTKAQPNYSFLYSNFYVLRTADEKTKGSGLNGSKHYANSLSSSFPPESNFDLILSSPNMGIVTLPYELRCQEYLLHLQTTFRVVF